MYVEGSIMVRDLLCALTLVVNLWSRGRCSISLEEFVAFASLMMLLKSDDGIHHITVGFI